MLRRCTTALLLLLLHLVGSDSALVAQATDGSGETSSNSTCSYEGTTSDILIDLNSQLSSNWNEPRIPLGANRRVVVTGVNPFMGRHRVQFAEVQLSTGEDPLDLAAAFLGFVLPGLGDFKLPEASTAAVDDTCDSELASETTRLLGEVSDGQDRLAAILGDLREIDNEWQTIRASRMADTLRPAVTRLQERLPGTLQTLKDQRGELESLARTLREKADSLRTSAEQLRISGGMDCIALALDAQRAADDASQTASTSIVVFSEAETTKRVAALEGINGISRSFANQCSDYRLVEVVPLKQRATVVDVMVQMSQPSGEDKATYVNLDHRRLRFQPAQRLDLKLVVGALWSSVPQITFGSRRLRAGGVPGATTDSIQTVVAVTNRSDDRLVPTVGLWLRPDLGFWPEFAGFAAGVGVNTAGDPTPNYFLGGGVSFGPVKLLVGLTAASVSVLAEGQSIGDRLGTGETPDLDESIRWGTSIGLLLSVR